MLNAFVGAGWSGQPLDGVLGEVSWRKKGPLSVGVGRQYLGSLGKVDNGQVAVSLHGVPYTPTKTCPISRWACGSVPVVRGHWDDRNMDLRTRSVPGDQGVGAKGARLRALARGRSALAAPGVPCRRQLSVGGRLQVHLVAQGLQSCNRAAGHAITLSSR